MPPLDFTWPVPLDPGCLRGRIVQLEPLTPSHDRDLVSICEDDRIWQYLTSYGGSPRAMRSYLEDARREQEAGTAVPFAIRRLAGEQLIGLTRLKELSLEHRTAIVGSWLVPASWGTGANTESKLLLLGYAFDTLQCLRVEFHTDSLNERSRAALRRLGAVEEGTRRSVATKRDGTRRDTVIFSVLAVEWPHVRNSLAARLARGQS